MGKTAIAMRKKDGSEAYAEKFPMPQPYISVTGITTEKEAALFGIAACTHFRKLKTRHMPALGALVNESTLAGYGTDNRRCPPIELIPQIFESALNMCPELFTVVHYACKDPQRLFQLVRKIMTIPGLYMNSEENGLCSAIQLNNGSTEVPVAELMKIKNEFPGLKIIYQIPRCDLVHGFEAVAKDVSECKEFIDYMLIDLFGGNDEALDTKFIRCGEKLREMNVAVGLAGGLNTNNIATRVKMYRNVFGDCDFSLDVECGARNPLSEKYGDDMFNLHKVNVNGLLANATRTFNEISREG